MLFVILIVLACTNVCRAAPGGGDKILVGETTLVAGGPVSTWARVNGEGKVIWVGATIPLSMVENQPPPGTGPAGAIDVLNYPPVVQQTTYFDHFELHSQAHGHPINPGYETHDRYSEPHFDFHFYSIPVAQVLTILLALPPLPDVPTDRLPGSSVTLAVAATGEPSLLYQWLLNDVPVNSGTNATLTLGNLTLGHSGSYSVLVSNSLGSVTSQTAVLNVAPLLITRTSGTNILFVIADDYGTDSLSLYNTNAGASLPRTPNLNSLYETGVLFRNAYAYPTCSPTRSSLITGRYGFRTGIGLAIAEASDATLQANELTIPRILAANPQLGYRHASIGKWHRGEQPTAPNVRGGWPHFSGSLPFRVDDYFRWSKTVNAATTITTNYATTNWFLRLAFNAPHSPLHKPPNHLHSYEALPADQNSITQNPRPYFEAVTEAMDTEFGRLLSHIDRLNTVVIFIGDNGTSSNVVQLPFSSTRAKFTLHEGGIRVPMIISGPVVANPRRENTNLVHTVDLFATILELAGANKVLPTNTVFDSRSLPPILTNGPVTPRDWVLSEQFNTTRPLQRELGRAIRNDTFKLIRSSTGTNFFNLLIDPDENVNLLANALTAEQATNYAALTNTLAGLQNFPEVTGSSYLSNRFAVSVGWVQSVQFSLHRSASLLSSPWTKVTTLSQTNNFVVTLTDTNAGSAQNFYRVSAPAR